MLKIAICDDEICMTTEIEKRLRSLGEQKHIDLDIDIYFDGQALGDAIQKNIYYDLIYMDIEMTHTDGIKAAHIIRELGITTLLIYISAYDSYFQKLFEVEPFRFLSKPIDTVLFDKYFDDAYKKLTSAAQFFSFSFKQIYYKLPLSDILYFESDKRDVIIHTDTRQYRFLAKLDDVEKTLQKYPYDFLRIHQSYIINPLHIRTLSHSYVILKNNCQLQISLKYRKQVHTQYLNLVEEL